MKNIEEYLTVPDADPASILLQNAAYFFMATEKGSVVLEENYQLQRFRILLLFKNEYVIIPILLLYFVIAI